MKLSDWGIGSTTPRPIAEYEAEGEIERVYHKIRQSLRVTGVNLVFRTWAGYKKFLPAMWDEMRPNVETTVFEGAANDLREQATRAAADLARQGAEFYAALGESRSYQIRAALDLYHYINPKLLLLTSAVVQALQGQPPRPAAAAEPERLQPGEPAKMYPMEMEDQKPEDKLLRRIFKDIRKTLGLPEINSDYRTLALWPDYLELAWNRLKPICQTPDFQRAADTLRDRARVLAQTLPYPVTLSLGRVRELGEDAERVQQTTRSFEQLLPGLILNIALLQLDWTRAAQIQASTTLAPGAASAPEVQPAWRNFQKRQKVMELGDRFLSYIDEGQGEPVLLLHGIPSWGFLWERLIPSLSKSYRVLAPDLPGYGYSDRRDCFDRSIQRQTEAMDALLGKLGLESAHLVGHDIGGGVALRLATLIPQRVRSLCLMNTVCYDSWPVEFMLQMGHPSNRRLPAAKSLKALKQALPFSSEPDSGWLDGLLSPWRTEVGKLSLIRNAISLDTNHTIEITRLLPSITIPTLIIWGENDARLPVKFGKRLAKDIPGASLIRIAGASHYVMIDQPERVQSAVRDFLARQAAPVQAAA